MKKICVITTSRADYGYLYWIIKDIEASDKLQLQIIVPTNHHNNSEIYREFALNKDNQVWGISDINSIADYARVYYECSQAYDILKPDTIVCLGDRYEMHAAATAALLLNIPISHIHGGETTTGSFDDNIRNAITQMSDIHFTAADEYAKNICYMKREYAYKDCITNEYVWNMNEDGFGYENWDRQDEKDKKEIRIFNVGSPAIDWLTRTKLLSKQELQQRVSTDLSQPFIVACLHTTTKELSQTETQTKEWLYALGRSDEQVLLIKPNIDPKNDLIREIIEDYYDTVLFAEKKQHMWYIADNLDHLTYLSLLQYAELVIGNSSSGIIEVSSFNKPVVNIGNRQAGRIKPFNVIDVKCNTNEILDGIQKAKEYSKSGKIAVNPYGDGNSSNRIVNILENV